MNELSLNRSLSRFAVVGISLVALALLAIFLKFVLVQLFVAIIIAAGMSPLVAAMTDPSAPAAGAGGHHAPSPSC